MPRTADSRTSTIDFQVAQNGEHPCRKSCCARERPASSSSTSPRRTWKTRSSRSSSTSRTSGAARLVLKDGSQFFVEPLDAPPALPVTVQATAALDRRATARLHSRGSDCHGMLELSREIALRIGLAARALPGVSVGALVNGLVSQLGWPLNEEKLAPPDRDPVAERAEPGRLDRRRRRPPRRRRRRSGSASPSSRRWSRSSGGRRTGGGRSCPPWNPTRRATCPARSGWPSPPTAARS